MTIEDLIKALQDKSTTSEAVQGFNARLKEREKEFGEYARKTRITNEFLNRQYII